MSDGGDFDDRFHVERFADASHFAAGLFRDAFNSDFPVPPKDAGWAQYVAFYRVAEVTPGQPLQDPGTGWFYSFSVWTATIASTSVPAPTYPS